MRLRVEGNLVPYRNLTKRGTQALTKQIATKGGGVDAPAVHLHTRARQDPRDDAVERRADAHVLAASGGHRGNGQQPPPVWR